ncbi:hypothetical protein [Aurantiacibacter zhengii]|uniref:Lipoprotein n=1 Tax=Aurantiacibacter zhengii TaxID=2307003 RepID=A0A418NP22_9SPHN|nr:hypothetical protein [Aurantiacibacter zhengii]RIV83925.1 hypothetical protein D2V07_15730 [Aurantiacibacter zhengii]
MISRATIALAVFATLAACTSPQQQRMNRESRAAERFLERQGSVGDPGRVAAADFAFAKMAREEGQWTAFREYAADDAVIHGQNGLIPAQPWLASMEDPEEAVAWAPNAVWSSCDGTLAATFGRFIEPEGMVGSYVSIWELQRDNSYRYTYDLGAPDDPQPAPRPEEDIPEGAIVVPGLASIEGRVADCAQAVPLSPDVTVPAGTASDTTRSADGTLEWTWLHGADGTRTVVVNWLRDGDWQEAVRLVAPAGSQVGE